MNIPQERMKREKSRNRGVKACENINAGKRDSVKQYSGSGVLLYLFYGKLFASSSRDLADALSILIKTKCHNLFQCELLTVRVKGALHVMLNLTPVPEAYIH